MKARRATGEYRCFYLPVGVTFGPSLRDGARAEAGIEWDQLLHGRENSRLSDAHLDLTLSSMGAVAGALTAVAAMLRS